MSYRLYYVFTQNQAEYMIPRLADSPFLRTLAHELRQQLFCTEEPLTDETIMKQIRTAQMFGGKYSKTQLLPFLKRLRKIAEHGLIVVGTKK